MRRPKEIIEALVDAFNRCDADALAARTTAKPPLATKSSEGVQGRGAIHTMFQRELAEAKIKCNVKILFEDDDDSFCNEP